MIERVGSDPVDARPWEIGLIWAYELQWRPLPVIQDYQAYTPALDRLNEGALTADDGPRYVLRHQGFDNSPAIGIDGRFTSFDVPLETLALVCRYRPVLTSSSYQLLAKAADRCGAPRPLGGTTAAYEEPVAVPRARPGEAIVARIDGAGPEGLELLRTLAFRAATRKIELNIGRARLAPENAESGLLLSLPPGADFPPPFAVAPGTSSFAISSADGPLSSDGPLEIEFLAVPVRALQQGSTVPLD